MFTSRWLVLPSLLLLGACADVTPGTIADSEGSPSIGGKADGFIVRGQGSISCPEVIERRNQALMDDGSSTSFRLGIANTADRTWMTGFISAVNEMEGGDVFGEESIESVEARVVTACEVDPMRTLRGALVAAMTTYRNDR